MLTYWFSLIEKAWKRYSLHRFIFLYIYTHINVYIYTVYIKIIYTHILYIIDLLDINPLAPCIFPCMSITWRIAQWPSNHGEDIPFNPLTNPDWFGCNFPLSWENDGNIAFKTIKPISTRRIWVPSHPLSGLCSSKVPSAACQDTVAMRWKRHGKTTWVWDVIPYPVDILLILNTLIWSQ